MSRPLQCATIPDMRDADEIVLDGVTYTGEKLRAIVASFASSAVGAPAASGAVVGYRISDPSEPDLGHWLSEEPGAAWCVSEPLALAKSAWQARASLAANAGREPVARVNDDGFIVEIGDLLIAPGQKLYLHPSPPEGMVGGWISVDERLPEPNVEVLCAGQGLGKPFVTACYYDDGRREWYPINTYWTDSTGSAQYPTHWMPLPLPPTSSADSRKGE